MATTPQQIFDLTHQRAGNSDRRVFSDSEVMNEVNAAIQYISALMVNQDRNWFRKTIEVEFSEGEREKELATLYGSRPMDCRDIYDPPNTYPMDIVDYRKAEEMRSDEGRWGLRQGLYFRTNLGSDVAGLIWKASRNHKLEISLDATPEDWEQTDGTVSTATTESLLFPPLIREFIPTRAVYCLLASVNADPGTWNGEERKLVQAVQVIGRHIKGKSRTVRRRPRW